MSSHKISLIFMGIAMVLFVIVKVLPKYKQSKTHVTGRIHVDKELSKKSDFTQDATGVFYDVTGEIIGVVNLEFADSAAKIKKGLSHRTSLDRLNGMLFVFKKLEPQNFWMKNTLFPLDIIFMNENGEVVQIVENTVPNSLELIKSKTPVKFVLEVNSGFVITNRIELGSKLTFEKKIKN